MKKLLNIVLPLLLVAMMIADSCGKLDFLEEMFPDGTLDEEIVTQGYLSAPDTITPFSQMQYARPDLEELQTLLDDACLLGEGREVDSIIDAADRFYQAVDWFNTCYTLADIHYSADLTDSYWEREYNYLSSNVARVDQMMDDLGYALAESPVRKRLEKQYFGEGFFESYDGDYVWADELVELMEQENALIQKYYTQSDDIGTLLSPLLKSERKAAQTLVDLIRVRKAIAEFLGYEDYISYANEAYYYRDYDPDEVTSYLEAIRRELVPIYRETWMLAADLPEAAEEQTFAYVRDAAQRMGGAVWDAFQLMEDAELYDIAYSENKFNSSFEMFIRTYGEPYILMNPEGTEYDFLTFAHEFGHFCNDFASNESFVGIDVAEIFSQGLEYLSLLYQDGTDDLVTAKMVDSLATYVEQACYTAFEQEMYRIPEDELSVDALCDLYSRLASEYGFDEYGFEPLDFVSVNHFYTNPMYVVSYIVSNDAAMQLYDMECEHPGKGLRIFMKNLDTEEPYFLAFLESAGLQSPFDSDRFASVCEDFRAFFDV